MKYCPKCGSELEEGVKFCPSCGTSLDSSNNVKEGNFSTSSKPVVTRREIAISIILTFITCGIYSIYWFIKMTDDANKVSEDDTTSGGMAFLFSIITCGIYTIYWHYKMGKKMYEAGRKYNMDIADNSIVYLLLSIFGFGIVNYCLIQNDLNKFA